MFGRSDAPYVQTVRAKVRDNLSARLTKNECTAKLIELNCLLVQQPTLARGDTTYRSKERLGHKSRPRVELRLVSSSLKIQGRGEGKPRAYEELHLGNFLVDFLHELDNKVDELVLQEVLGVEVRDQEGDVIALKLSVSCPTSSRYPSSFLILTTSFSTKKDGAISRAAGNRNRSGYKGEKQPTLIGFLLRMKKLSALCSRNRVNLCTRIFSTSSACLIRMLTRTLLTLGSIKTRSFSLRATVSGVSSTSGEVRASTSGTLWRSEAWEAKLVRVRAAVRVLRTHWR